MTKTENFIVSGPKLHVDGVDELIGDLIFRSLKKLPGDKIFQVVVKPYEKITVREFFKLSAQICESLIRQGLKKGEIVTVVGDNSSQLHASFIGAIWAGGIPNPIAGSCTVQELKVYLEKIKPKWIFCESPEFSNVSKCVEILKIKSKIFALNSSPSLNGDIPKLEDILQDIDLDGFTPICGGSSKDVALILCSSGTTGAPKGVALSHFAFLNSFLKWQYMPCVDFARSQIITSYFSWITGVLLLLMSCIYGCDRIITLTNDPEELLQTIEEYKVHGILIPPPLLSRVLDSPNFKKYDLTSVREVYTGGSVLGRHTTIQFFEKWKTSKLYLIYGMTEAGFLSMPSPNQPIESSGSPFYDTTLKIVDIDTEKILGPNQLGEIYTKSNAMFTEYIGDEEATKNALVDGWIRTGDLGYLDENGNVFICSRLKEIFKIDNIQISPVEIETFLSSLPGVDDVGIVGIPISEYSIILMALVVKSQNSTITAQDIQKSVADNFSEKKHLKAGVYFVDECPRSPSRKLRRNKLAEMAMGFYNKNQLPAQ